MIALVPIIAPQPPHKPPRFMLIYDVLIVVGGALAFTLVAMTALRWLDQ